MLRCRQKTGKRPAQMRALYNSVYRKQQHKTPPRKMLAGIGKGERSGRSRWFGTGRVEGEKADRRRVGDSVHPAGRACVQADVRQTEQRPPDRQRTTPGPQPRRKMFSMPNRH